MSLITRATEAHRSHRAHQAEERLRIGSLYENQGLILAGKGGGRSTPRISGKDPSGHSWSEPGCLESASTTFGTPAPSCSSSATSTPNSFRSYSSMPP